MKYLIWAGVILLVVLHQDNWLWEDDTLVMGFFPIGLLWHVGISIGASILWCLATIYAWPSQLEYDAEEQDQ